MIRTLNHFIPQGTCSFTLEKLGGEQATPASGFVLISESRVHQLTSGFYARIHSQHTWMGFGWDKEKLRREVGKNLVPLEQGLANDSCWCKYFHCNTDSSFVCIISVAVLTYTGKGGLPQKTCGPKGLKLLLSGPLKKCLPTPVEKAMAPHSSTLAWKILWMEEPGRLQSMGSLRVGHDWATSLSLFTCMHWRRKWQPTPVFLPGESQGQGSLVGCRLRGHT